MSDLLPCPFCGGDAYYHDIGNSHTKSRGTKIWCASCRFEKTVKAFRQDLDWTRSHAIAAWNTRSSTAALALPEVKALVDALRRALDADYFGSSEAMLGPLRQEMHAVLRAIEEAKP